MIAGHHVKAGLGRRPNQLGVAYTRAGAAALGVDDTAVEDELEPLYQHANKMDNGWSGGRR